ncbi:hypothetical protein BDV28DRAFT_126535 [Aspergillus coremiiformis]|uniref:Uncharacterized protein n=1 Tax=Aspergillus coremiiformis TaxID=138285 RepID=A0A5N6ZJ27_9EURO|nr:hypothetical protein BDV28DRAFT_126535 [Aspergillus coremiiformis]
MQMCASPYLLIPLILVSQVVPLVILACLLRISPAQSTKTPSPSSRRLAVTSLPSQLAPNFARGLMDLRLINLVRAGWDSDPKLSAMCGKIDSESHPMPISGSVPAIPLVRAWRAMNGSYRPPPANQILERLSPAWWTTSLPNGSAVNPPWHDLQLLAGWRF